MGHARRRFRMTRSRVIATLAACGAIAALLVFVSAAAALPTCTDNFTGSSGGDWSVASNWSTNAVPTSSTVACWGAGVTVVVSTSDTADSIQGGVLDINGGTLDLTNASDDSTVGNVTLGTSSTLDGPSPLTIDGVPVGRRLPVATPATSPPAGSCITVAVTDAPLDSAACARVARRAGLGLARTGSVGHHASGEIFLALATGLRAPRQEAPASPVGEPPAPGRDQLAAAGWIAGRDRIAGRGLDPFFAAVVEATEEAVLNSMLAAPTVVGRDGNVSRGLPAEQVKAMLHAPGLASPGELGLR